ncbi:MAG: hypothetical protein IPM46_08470 [Flavobacteriales bacterium]|nr:hypothetical protein [Flavobacteriales bacterium]
MKRITTYNAGILMCIDDLLQQLTDEQLAQSHAMLHGSSIGGHLRHVLEFYSCLLAPDSEGSFSYDDRMRDPLIEREVRAARDKAAHCLALLHAVHTDRTMMMQSELPGELGRVEQQTSLARELAYLADHGVHHLAMVRIALAQALPHVRFPEHLGYAASTRNHQARSIQESA